MGVLGAAIATTIATIMSNLLLISKGRSLIGQWRLALWTEKSSEGNTSLRDIKEDVESADQNDKMKEYLVLPFISLPDRESFRSLVFLAGPIFLVMMAKLIEFWCMTTGANSFGLISTACHNLLMRIFLFFAVFGDGISQASQTFLPGLFKKNRVVKKKKASKSARSKEADQVIRRLALISASLGVFISITAWWIANNAGGAFTTDNQLVSLMAKTSTYMGANLLLNPLAEMFEGVIIASGEMRYLLAARGVVMALFLTALRTSVCKLTDIWKLLLVFQSIKILLGIQFCWKRKKSAEG
jgi:Na+-driven multidrug efflux pump